MQGDMAGLASAGLWAAFLLGLTGGFGHCLAMCGPFVAAASLAEGCAVSNVRRGLGFQVGYHAGRISTYMVIGAALGLLGQAGAWATLASPLQFGAPTQWLKLVAGALTVASGVVLLVSALRGRGVRLPEPTRAIAGSAWFSRTSAKLLSGGSRWGFALGALMGLLPCMPILPAELAALASGAPLYGALTMLAFGLGTTPALAGFGAASGLLGAKSRGWFSVASGVVVVALGAVVIWQGLALAAGA